MTHEFEDDGMRHSGIVPTWQERKAELHGSLKRSEVDGMNRLRMEALRERDEAIKKMATLQADLTLADDEISRLRRDAARYRAVRERDYQISLQFGDKLNKELWMLRYDSATDKATDQK